MAKKKKPFNLDRELRDVLLAFGGVMFMQVVENYLQKRANDSINKHKRHNKIEDIEFEEL